MTPAPSRQDAEDRTAGASRLAPVLFKLLLLAFLAGLQWTALPGLISRPDLQRAEAGLASAGQAAQVAQRAREAWRNATAEWRRSGPDRHLSPPPQGADPAGLAPSGTDNLPLGGRLAQAAVSPALPALALPRDFDARAPPAAA
jgi:hypothetical protein